MARILGAPLTVPAGNVAASTSTASRPSSSSAVTRLVRCMTWEKRSTIMSFSTSTVPGRASLPRSLRPRSTSIMCSARSLGSAMSSSARASSSATVAPRRLVPAMGAESSLPFSQRTMTSGEEPNSVMPGRRMKNMYGDAFSLRMRRYRVKGSPSNGMLKRTEGTT